MRSRLKDLVPLMIEENNAKSGQRVRHVPEAVYCRMRGYEWPGNVRELRNVVERRVLLATGEVIPERWLQFGQGPIEPEAGARVEGNRVIIPLDGSMDSVSDFPHLPDRASPTRSGRVA